MRKAVIIIVIILVLLILVFLRIQCARRSRAGEIEKAPMPIEVMTVEKGDVSNTCEVLGSLTARKTAEVFPETEIVNMEDADYFQFQMPLTNSGISGAVASVSTSA